MELIAGVVGQKVLIIDDTQTIRSLVRGCLKNLGFSAIAEATNGNDAWRILSNHTADLIICDHEMPGMSGLELLRKLRELDRYDKVPIIMLTGNADAELVNECIALGIDGFIVKPFQPRALQDKVVSVCRPRRS